jgi:hypothetical protein
MRPTPRQSQPGLALPPSSIHSSGMEVSGTVQCPFCGQVFELVIDTSGGSQRLTIDCEVCCRPLEVFAECELGEILSLDARGD